MIYLVDNYDSFTYNLYQLLGTLTQEPITVIHNDDLGAAELLAKQPTGVVFSPGPGRPEAAGNMPAMIQALRGHVPILGVCLGEQAIAQAYGGDVVAAKTLMHGKTSTITNCHTGALFTDCPNQFAGARYHSLVVAAAPAGLTLTAVADDGSVMALENATDRVYGVQFHPESIMTDPAVGAQLLKNFLAQCA
ncbi:MAG: aminodeoxychorismate/anthranilate synthase component II [Lactobacillus sp.]|jgi:anthranilate synthase component 2|nr:aminodeoxychorismate/anthranilate synthase component II [Lactobacillus sp.]MCI2033820.1 aminodeoxychorismate/anthranilate synthase component II [Lactobacillus sp.]